MLLRHDDLIELRTFLGYSKNFEGGVCAGFSGMWAQAVLAQEENNFYERLKAIAKSKQNSSLETLANRIKKIPEDYKIIQRDYNIKDPRNLTADEKKQLTETQKKQLENQLNMFEKRLGVLTFYDGIEMYLNPHKHQDYFPDHTVINQNSIKEIFSLIKSKTLDKKNIETLLDKDYVFTEDKLKQYFEDLAKILSQSQSNIPIILGSANHAVCLKYNNQKNRWEYLDTNKFVDDMFEENYYRELDTQELVKNIFSSFHTNSYAVFNTTLLTVEPDIELKTKMQIFDSNYPIEAEYAKTYDETGWVCYLLPAKMAI